MGCQTHISLIEQSTFYIYGALSILGCILTIIGNILSLLVLSIQHHKTRYLKLLMWLSSADLLIGLLVFPTNAYQFLSESTQSCTVNGLRIYFEVLFMGMSVLVLTVLTIDRYILIAKFQLYQKRKTKYCIWVLLAQAWLFPLVVSNVRLLSLDAYFFILFVMFFVPFIVMVTSYVLLTKTVREKEKKCQIPNAVQASINNNRSDVSANPNTTSCTMYNVLKHKQSRRLKLAKNVVLLIVVYFFCILPLMSWLVLGMVNRTYDIVVEPHAYQDFYLFSVLASSYNSCFNPFIYFAKNPKLRKRLRKLFRLSTVVAAPAELNGNGGGRLSVTMA